MTKKCYLLDLDGTMYRGTAIIEGAKVFIDYCLKEQLPFLFLTIIPDARRARLRITC